VRICPAAGLHSDIQDCSRLRPSPPVKLHSSQYAIQAAPSPVSFRKNWPP
jgi:hypothetical protein